MGERFNVSVFGFCVRRGECPGRHELPRGGGDGGGGDHGGVAPDRGRHVRLRRHERHVLLVLINI